MSYGRSTRTSDTSTTWKVLAVLLARQSDAGGADTVNQEHFVLLDRQGRESTMTTHNTWPGWSKAGLFPYNRSRVLDRMSEPVQETSAPPSYWCPSWSSQARELLDCQNLVTPTTFEGVRDLYRMLEDT